MNKIQMNASVSPELRTDIQTEANTLGLTASDALALLPSALAVEKQRIERDLLQLLSGEPTPIPLCDLFSFYGVNPNIFEEASNSFFNGGISNASYEELYRKEFCSRGGAMMISLLDVLTGASISSLYVTNSAGLPFQPTYFSLPNLWKTVNATLRSHDGIWNVDIPMMIECQLMGTLKKGTSSSGFTGIKNK